MFYIKCFSKIKVLLFFACAYFVWDEVFFWGGEYFNRMMDKYNKKKYINYSCYYGIQKQESTGYFLCN